MDHAIEFEDSLSAFRTSLAAAAAACGGAVRRVSDSFAGGGPDKGWLRDEAESLAAEARSWSQLPGHASAALAASAAAASPLPEAGFQKRRRGILGFVASLKAVPAELIPDEEASAAAGASQVPQALRDAVDYALSVARDRRAELAEAALAAKEAALALEASDSLAERRRLYGIEELASALVAQQEAILLSSRELERAVPRPREPFTAHLAPEEA